MSLQSVFRRSIWLLKLGSPKDISLILSQQHLRTNLSVAPLRNVTTFSRNLRGKNCEQKLILTCVRYSSAQSTTSSSFSPAGLADQVLKSRRQNEKENEETSGNENEKEKEKQQQNQLRALKFTLYAFGSMFVGSILVIFFIWGAPLRDKHGNELKDEFSDLPFFQQYSKRAVSEVRNYLTFLANPSREKLLPDPVKPPYVQPPYTVLIELTGVLVHPEWTYKTGWRFKKRPGIDYFLNQLATGFQFEIVIFTSELGFTAFPIVDALDTQGVVLYRLFRDSTKYENGVHVKDLTKINRDLNGVIMIDWDAKAVKEHRNNTIVLPRWRGNDDDRVLFDLAALLQTISTSEIQDVRPVLEYYSKYEDPIAEFREKQKLLAAQERQREASLKYENKSTQGYALNTSWLLSFFRK